MGQFAVCIFTAGLILLASYIVYKWLLASENQPDFNRTILLAIYGVSFILPAISNDMPSLSALSDHTATVELGDMTATVRGESGGVVNTTITVMLWIYLCGMIVAALHTLGVALKIRRIIASGERVDYGDYTLVLISSRDIAPFSWQRYVVMSRGEDSEAARIILCHERAHISCRHFADLLLAQAVCIVLWYNPASWLMLSELKSVHEYQADSRVLAAGVNSRQYQLLLIKKAVGVRFQSLANSLNHSKLKKRVTMMYNQKTSAGRRTRALALLPAVAFTLALVSIPSVTNALDRTAGGSLYFTSGEIHSKVTNSHANGQMSVQETYAGSADEKTMAVPDKLPQYPGGEQELLRYLMYNVRYPEEAQKTGAEGKVVVHFTVKADGTISDVNVTEPVNPALDAEAIRVVKAMNVRWVPGESGGKKIDCSFSLPISFKLTNDRKSK